MSASARGIDRARVAQLRDGQNSLQAESMPESSEVSMAKAALRQHHLRQRKDMQKGMARALSSQAQRRVLELPAFTEARTVGLYAPMGNEVDTQLICEEVLKHDAVAAYPGVVCRRMEFVRYAADCAWVPGAFGILEPRSAERHYNECVVAPDEFDVIIIPGVAFDCSGNRLGYGKGFYDRYLPQCGAQCVFVGLAYDFQLEDKLPCEQHDICLNYVVTNSRTIECSAPGRYPSD